MQALIDSFSVTISSILILPLIGTGIYLTIRLKLVQLIHFEHSWKVIAGIYDDPKDTGDINHLQALSAALSATIGIGNIAGVATAIHFGGPGALFWMWVTAFVGMATKFTEATLAMNFRKIHEDGSASGGPMYYIEKGLGKSWKPMAVVFAFCTIISSFGSGNTVQAFTVGDSFHADFGIPSWVSGFVLASLVAMVILGGIKRIGIVASRLVPFMALVYIVSALWVIGANIDHVPEALRLIFESAFTARAGIGGFAGSTFFMALLWGVKRGLFSNESGQGSAPIAHAAAKTEEPVREGTVAMIGPFIDTLVICTLTGLTIITSGAWNTPYPMEVNPSSVMVVREISPSTGRPTELRPGGKVEADELFVGESPIKSGKATGVKFVYNQSFFLEPNFYFADDKGNEAPVAYGSIRVDSSGAISVFRAPEPMKGMQVPGSETALLLANTTIHGRGQRNGSLLTAQAFETGLGGKWGSWLVTFGVFLFAISTTISWSYYGDRATVYLFGLKGVRIYRMIYVVIIFIGANLALEAAWGFGDIALSFMAFPNLIALVFLAKRVQIWKEDYFNIEHKPISKAHF